MIRQFINSKFKKDISFSYISQAIVLLFGFVQLFLINKYYGIEMFGQLMIVISIVGLVLNFVTVRNGEAVVKFLRIHEYKENLNNAKFILFCGIFLDIITGIILLTLLYFSSGFMANTFMKSEQYDTVIVIYSFISFLLLIRSSFVGFIQAKEMIVHIYIINIIDAIIKVFGIYVCIFFLNQTSLIGIIYIFLAATIITTLYLFVIFYITYDKVYRDIKVIFDTAVFKEYLVFSWKTFLSSSLKAGSQNIDNLILAYFLSPMIVGLYQTMKKIVSPILMISSPFSTAVYPKLVYYFEDNRREQFIGIIKKVSIYIFLFVIGYGIITSIILENIFNLMNLEFFPKYYQYYFLILCLNMFIALLWWGRIFSNTVNPNYSLYMNLFAFLYQICIIIVVTLLFGFYGFIIGMLLLYGIIYTYYFYKLKRY